MHDDRAPDGKWMAVASHGQAGAHSSLQPHWESPSGEADALMLLWLWSHFIALCKPTHLIPESPCCQPGGVQLPNVTGVASSLFSMCLCRAFSVSFMEVSYILLWSQEDDSSLVFPPPSSIGTEIKGGRRPSIFPISEPQDWLLSTQQMWRAKR